MTHFHNTRRYKMAYQKKKKKKRKEKRERYKMKNLQTRSCLEVKMRATIFF